MSKSATLYRIPAMEDGEGVIPGARPRFSWDAVKDSAIFEGSSPSLVLVLSKEQPPESVRLLEQIFSPPFAAEKDDFTEWIFGEDETPVRYLPPHLVRQIHALLEDVTETDVRSRFEPKDWNRNEIHPGTWIEDNSNAFPFQIRQLVQDVANIKTIFRRAADEDDFILVFVG